MPPLIPGGESRIVKLPDSGGIQVHYVTAGHGSPVILIHGLGASAVTWRDNVAALALRHSVYAIDVPGHGDSDKPDSDYSIDTVTGWLLGFQRALGLERPALIANSAAGVVALNIATEHRDAVSALVLVATVGFGRELPLYVRLVSIPLLGEILESPRVGRPGMMLKGVFSDQRFATPELARELYRSRAMPGAKEAVVRPIRQWVGLRGLRREMLLLDDLASLSIPTLIVWGEEDGILPVSQARAAAEHAPGARLHVFDRCGHWPHMERAGEFNELVLDFLSGT